MKRLLCGGGEGEEPFQRGLMEMLEEPARAPGAGDQKTGAELETSVRPRKGTDLQLLSFVWAFILLYCLSFFFLFKQKQNTGEWYLEAKGARHLVFFQETWLLWECPPGVPV